jgi:ribonucleoside-diphosphate reductase alpha chain
VKIATIIGTYQSTLTDFRYLRNIWKKNAEEERLLGVSLTGIMDHPVISRVTEDAKNWLAAMRIVAIQTNEIWAKKLGIEPSVAVSCTKPSGTVAELVDSASGIHPRYAAYYIRSVRNDIKDPLANLLRDQGIPFEPDVTNPSNILVFSFPKKSPDASVMRHDISALDQLNHYRMVRNEWCEHNPSITVYIKPHEWLAVGDWIYNNWDEVGGISFLPFSEHNYRQAPFLEISSEEYQTLERCFPDIDYTAISNYEKDDTTTSSHELACTGNACMIE